MTYTLTIWHNNAPITFEALTGAFLLVDLRVWLMRNRANLAGNGATIRNNLETVALRKQPSGWRLVWDGRAVCTNWITGKKLFAEICGQHIRYKGA